VAPQTTGMDPAPFSTLRRSLRSWVKERKIAGGYVALATHKGKLVHADSHTHPDVKGRPLAPDSIMRLYSMTKTLTAAAVMAAVEDGKLALDDQVGKWLPAWRNIKVAHIASSVEHGPKSLDLDTPLTVRHLITHTCGIGYCTLVGEEKAEDAQTKAYNNLCRQVDAGKLRSLGAYVDALAKVPLRFQPGTKWEYGFGFDVAGRVLEKATGRFFADYIEDRIFKPAGMCDTGFCVRSEDADRMAPVFRRHPWEKQVTEDPKKPSGKSAWISNKQPNVCSPGGAMGANHTNGRGMVSTPQDTLRFCLMLRSKGVSPETGKRVLKAETVQNLARNWLPDPSVCGTPHEENDFSWGPGLGYSPLGQIGVNHPKKKTWFRTQSLDKVENLDGELGHGGWLVTYWSWDPVEDVIQVFFVQHPESTSLKGNADLWKACRSALVPCSRRVAAAKATSAAGQKRKAATEWREVERGLKKRKA